MVKLTKVEFENLTELAKTNGFAKNLFSFYQIRGYLSPKQYDCISLDIAEDFKEEGDLHGYECPICDFPIKKGTEYYCQDLDQYFHKGCKDSIHPDWR
jgi:hypothetical protein